MGLNRTTMPPLHEEPPPPPRDRTQRRSVVLYGEEGDHAYVSIITEVRIQIRDPVEAEAAVASMGLGPDEPGWEPMEPSWALRQIQDPDDRPTWPSGPRGGGSP